MSKVSNLLNDPSAADAQRRARVRAAALPVFARFGLRRTTMADIAAAAGMSRPALYLLYPNKTSVFTDLAVAMIEASLDAALAAWPPGMAVAEGLAAALLAKDLEMFRQLAASPHGAEMLAEGTVLTQAAHEAVAARFADLLEARLAAAGAPQPAALARMLVKAADGIKHAGGSEADYIADIKQLAALVAGAVRG